MTRHRQEPEALVSFFRDLERLAYSLLIRKAGINERIERFSQLTAAVAKGSNLAEDTSPLQLTSTDQFEVYAKLEGAFYESFAARARTTILLRLDMLLSEGDAQYDYMTITVEHVLPQSPADGSSWLAWFPTENDRIRWVHTLGNLALLTRKKNSAASNYEFERKKQSYFAQGGISPFVLTTQVLSQSQWTPTVVSERQKQLLTLLEKHWRLHDRRSPNPVKRVGELGSAPAERPTVGGGNRLNHHPNRRTLIRLVDTHAAVQK
jgi:hypothetical protein